MPELSRKEHPDRVFGLRETKQFDEALSCPMASQPSRTLGSVLRISPFKNVGEPLLFPFLILEAKSEKGSDDWDSIEKQTAFPIRTLLKLQQDLYDYTNEKSHWRDGPLVWFLSNKGEDWRVYGCFTDITNEILEYVRLTRKRYAIITNCIICTIIQLTSIQRIVSLWKGSMRSKDEASQLLLIIDHIFDWARDSYTRSLLRQIRSLSAVDSSETMTIGDSDIWSLRPPEGDLTSDSVPEQPPEIAAVNDPHENGYTSPPIHPLDSLGGAFRYAYNVESEFSALLITRDSVNTMLRSFGTEGAAKKYASEVLNAMAGKFDVMKITGQTLTKLEHLWTEESEMPANPVISTTRFYTNLVFKAGLTADWHQVRQLCCLAIAEDAFDWLVKFSGRCRISKPRVFEFDEGPFLDIFRSLRLASADFTLHASINRLALGIRVKRTFIPDTFSGLIGGEPWEPAPGFDNGGGPWFGLIKVDYSLIIQDVVDKIYIKTKLGRREPSDAFIRQSVALDERSPQDSTKRPFPLGPNLEYVSDGVVVVVGECENGKAATCPKVCVYIFAQTPEGSERRRMIQILEKTESSDWVIHWTRRHAPNKSVRSDVSNLAETQTTAKKAYRTQIQELIAHLQREEGSYSHSLPPQHRPTLADDIAHLVQPAPSDRESKEANFSAGKLHSRTSKLLQRHDKAWAILTTPDTLEYLCAHCRIALLSCGLSNPDKALLELIANIQGWHSGLDDALKEHFGAARGGRLEEAVNRLLYTIMNDHGISGIRLLLLLKDLRTTEPYDWAQSNDSEDHELIEAPMSLGGRKSIEPDETTVSPAKQASDIPSSRTKSQDLSTPRSPTSAAAGTASVPGFHFSSVTRDTSTSSPPPDVSNNDAALALLIGMGFEATWCEVALDTCGRENPRQAIDWLLQQSEFLESFS